MKALGQSASMIATAPEPPEATCETAVVSRATSYIAPAINVVPSTGLGRTNSPSAGDCTERHQPLRQFLDTCGGTHLSSCFDSSDSR